MLKIEPGAITPKFKLVLGNVVPEIVKGFNLRISFKTFKSQTLRATSHQLLVRLKHLRQVAFAPLGIGLIPQPLIVGRVPLGDAIHGGELVVRKLALQDPRSGEVVGVTVKPAKPKAFFVCLLYTSPSPRD